MMHKGTFAIYTRNGGEIKIDNVNGYLLDFGALRFGCRKSGRQWSITELSTGMLIGLYADRKRDIIPLLAKNTDMLIVAQKKINDAEDKFIQDAKERIRAFYAGE